MDNDGECKRSDSSQSWTIDQDIIKIVLQIQPRCSGLQALFSSFVQTTAKIISSLLSVRTKILVQRLLCLHILQLAPLHSFPLFYPLLPRHKTRSHSFLSLNFPFIFALLLFLLRLLCFFILAFLNHLIPAISPLLCPSLPSPTTCSHSRTVTLHAHIQYIISPTPHIHTHTVITYSCVLSCVIIALSVQWEGHS